MLPDRVPGGISTFFGGGAEWLRKWAQAVAERRLAAVRRQTELAEENLRKAMAFSGSAD